MHKLDRPRNWVIYGRSKTGKTTFAGTFPKPALLIDLRDRGTDSVLDVKELDVATIEDLDTFEEVYHGLLNGDLEYETVILDTMTQLQSMVIEDVQGGKRKNGKAAGAWGSMTKGDWGEVSGTVKEYIDQFLELPLETVFLAQDKVINLDDENDEDNVLLPEVGPAMMPSVVKHMNAGADIIGNTFIKLNVVTKEVRGKKKRIEKPVYCLRIGPNPVYTTGIRKPRGTVPPDYIENASFEDVMEVIKGE